MGGEQRSCVCDGGEWAKHVMFWDQSDTSIRRSVQVEMDEGERRERREGDGKKKKKKERNDKTCRGEKVLLHDDHSHRQCLVWCHSRSSREFGCHASPLSVAFQG